MPQCLEETALKIHAHCFVDTFLWKLGREPNSQTCRMIPVWGFYNGGLNAFHKVVQLVSARFVSDFQDYLLSVLQTKVKIFSLLLW
jgi:hypothetical protein